MSHITRQSGGKRVATYGRMKHRTTMKDVYIAGLTVFFIAPEYFHIVILAVVVLCFFLPQK